MLVSSDKPATPTVTKDVSDPVDGDAITLTCTTVTSGINTYDFKRDGTTVASGVSSNTHVLSAAAIGTDDGSYTCIAYIATVASLESSGLAVDCK